MSGSEIYASPDLLHLNFIDYFRRLYKSLLSDL